MTGTHDTEPLAAWWRAARAAGPERAARRSTVLARRGGRPTSPGRRRCATRSCAWPIRPASDELFLPVQDLFGWPDRVNVPGTVGPENWTWALPWPVERLDTSPRASSAPRSSAALASAATVAAQAYG